MMYQNEYTEKVLNLLSVLPTEKHTFEHRIILIAANITMLRIAHDSCRSDKIEHHNYYRQNPLSEWIRRYESQSLFNFFETFPDDLLALGPDRYDAEIFTRWYTYFLSNTGIWNQIFRKSKCYLEIVEVWRNCTDLDWSSDLIEILDSSYRIDGDIIDDLTDAMNKAIEAAYPESIEELEVPE